MAASCTTHNENKPKLVDLRSASCADAQNKCLVRHNHFTDYRSLNRALKSQRMVPGAASNHRHADCRHCQTKATMFEISRERVVSGGKLTPFDKSGRAVQFEGPAVIKVTFLVEVIVKR
jgi:hypothetical protein